MNIMFLSKVRSLPVYPVTVMTCIRKDNSIKWLKWYKFLTFQLWLSNFVQGAIFLVFTHMMTWLCWCTKQKQNVAKVLHNNIITIPKDLFRYCSVHQHGSGDVTWKTRIQNMHVKIMQYECTVILKNLRSPTHHTATLTDFILKWHRQVKGIGWSKHCLC